MRVCIYIYIYVCMYVLSVFMYVCLCMYVYICVYLFSLFIGLVVNTNIKQRDNFPH